MTTLASRVIKKREALGLSQRALAKKINTSQQSINKLEMGLTRNPRKLHDLAQALGVDEQWLLFGNSALTPTEPDIQDSSLIACEWESMEQDKHEFIEIAVLNVELAAGDGAMAEHEREVYALPFRRYTLSKMGVTANNARVVRVIGNSMSPVLRSGDVVGIDTANRSPIIDGDLYAIRDGNLIRVKQLVARPDGGIIIRSFNHTDYPDEHLNYNEYAQRIHIIGRVFWSSTLW